LDLLLNGQIIFALRQLDQSAHPMANNILRALTGYFDEVWIRNNSTTSIRNDLAHLNMLQGDPPAPRLTHWINQTRQLMAYDRKLKNAVSKSVIELMAREGLELHWDMQIEGKTHHLTNARLSSRSATHLGRTRLTIAGKDAKPRHVPVTETLHSAGYLAMAAEAFGGRVQPRFSIVENLPNINWEASAEKKEPRDYAGQTGSKRPPSRRTNWRQTTKNA
jgi:hypothetical protein